MSVSFGDSVLRLDSQNVAARPGLAAYAGKQIVLGIRPEAFEAAAAIGAEGDVPVKVSLVEQLGSEAFVHFAYDSRPVVTEDIRELLADEGADESTLGDTTRFVARINPDFAPALGDDIRLAVDTAKLHFFDPESSQAIY